MSRSEKNTSGFWETYGDLYEVSIDPVHTDSGDMPPVVDLLVALLLKPLFVLFLALPIWIYLRITGK